MMRRALELARQAGELGEVPVGAVVYRGDQILARAFNRREAKGDPTAHAELIAVRRAARRLGDWRLNECSVAVTLEPCPMCAGMLVNARVGRLVFGAPDPKAGAVETLYQICTDSRLNHRIEIIPGVLPQECGDLLTSFFRAKRAQKNAQNAAE